jgi:signal transduction histidine kinase
VSQHNGVPVPVPAVSTTASGSAGGTESLLLDLFGRSDDESAIQARLGDLLDVVRAASGDDDLPVTLRRILVAGRSLVAADFVALRLDDIGDLDVLRVGSAAPVEAVLEVPIGIPGRRLGVLYVGGKRSGEPFVEQDESLARALAAIIAFTVGNALRNEEATRRRAWLDAIAEITGSLLSVSAPDDALWLVARRAREVTGADLASIVLPREPGTLAIAVSDGAGDDRLRGELLTATTAVYADALRTGCAVHLGGPGGADDATDDPDTAGSLFPGVAIGVPLGPAMVLPLVAAGRALGALVVAGTRGGRPFGELDREMAAAFAGQAALALQMARAQGERERLAVFEDRDRIARDLHDVVIQRVFATGLQVQALARSLDGPARTKLEAAVGELDRTIDDIRRTVFGLQASAGGDALRAQIWEIAASAIDWLGVEPDVRLEGPVDHAVPERIHSHLLAALRETLSNIARHARATRIHVLVRVTTDEVLVQVRDNGCGPGGSLRTSGLANLRRRAQDLGGHMEFGPGRDGTGTTVTWTVPNVR